MSWLWQVVAMLGFLLFIFFNLLYNSRLFQLFLVLRLMICNV